LFVLGALVLSISKLVFFQVTFIIILVSGILLWLFGRPALHVGASTVVMGYWSFLLSTAFQQQSPMTIILAVVCIYYFAGLVLSLFPTEERVSWEGHIFGFLGGLVASYCLTHNLLPTTWNFLL
jgi:membrane associated rhomboid family serine protease